MIFFYCGIAFKGIVQLTFWNFSKSQEWSRPCLASIGVFPGKRGSSVFPRGVYSCEKSAANREKVDFGILASTYAEFHAEHKDHLLFGFWGSYKV